MASGDDLVSSFLDLPLPDSFDALTFGENSSLLVPEYEHNDFVGFVPSAATSDVFSLPPIENSNTDQGTSIRTSSFDQETAIVTQNQNFHQEDDFSKYFNTDENFHDMSSSCVFSSGQRENVYSGNCVETLSNKLMTTGLQSSNFQHGPLEQSYQHPLLSQTIPDFSNQPCVSTMVRSNIQQQVEKADEPTNLNLIQHGFQDHYFPPSRFQEEPFDHNDLLFNQLMRIHGADYQKELPKFSNVSTPTSESRNYSAFTQSSYQPDSLAHTFQNSSSINPPRRQRGRPRKNQSVRPSTSSWTNTTPNNMSLVPTTQTLLNPPRPYGAQDKGKQHVTDTSMPSLNQPILYNQYQNSHTNSLIQQSGGLRQRSCYDQFENEGSSSKIRRTMFPLQEKSIAATSVISPWQNGNMSSNGANHHEKRLENTLYNPFYVGIGLAIDPHLRNFK